MVESKQVEKDLNGREVQLGRVPSIGTRLIILGNEYRVIYARENPVRITLELSKKYETKSE